MSIVILNTRRCACGLKFISLKGQLEVTLRPVFNIKLNQLYPEGMVIYDIQRRQNTSGSQRKRLCWHRLVNSLTRDLIMNKAELTEKICYNMYDMHPQKHKPAPSASAAFPMYSLREMSESFINDSGAA